VLEQSTKNQRLPIVGVYTLQLECSRVGWWKRFRKESLALTGSRKKEAASTMRRSQEGAGQGAARLIGSFITKKQIKSGKTSKRIMGLIPQLRVNGDRSPVL